MTVITIDRLSTAQDIVTKLMEQGQLLFTDIADTAKDRARLAKEVEQRDGVIERLTTELQDTRARCRGFEERCNKLIDDATRMDSMLADAHARLDAIMRTARPDLEPPKRPDGNDPAGAAGVAALKRLAATSRPRQNNNSSGGPTS
jgi:chromosome segregation ATPase